MHLGSVIKNYSHAMFEHLAIDKNLFKYTNSSKAICFSACGKMIVTGEHAVLHGYPCIILGVDRRITVSLKPLDTDDIILNSDIFSRYKTNLNTLLKTKSKDLPRDWLFVLTACQKLLKTSNGFILNVQSDVPPTVGLGSSAAVTVATVACLLSYTKVENSSTETLFNTCYDIVYTAQGKAGSGADLIASILGGLTYFHPRHKVLHKAQSPMDFSAFYSGYKTRTPDVIKHIQHITSDWKKEDLDALYKNMGALTNTAWQAIENEDPIELGRNMTLNHKALQDLGASDETLDIIVEKLNSQPNVSGAKLSGAGLGDCVIALGRAEQVQDYERIDIPIARQGLRRE